MNKLTNHIRYLPSHEWGRIDEEGILTVGISNHAQDLLGDIVFIELPEIGKQLDAEEESAIVESVKAASDIYAPLAGEVIEINEKLIDETDSLPLIHEGALMVGQKDSNQTGPSIGDLADMMFTENYSMMKKIQLDGGSGISSGDDLLLETGEKSFRFLRVPSVLAVQTLPTG